MTNDSRPATPAAISALTAMLQTLRNAPGGVAALAQVQKGARVRDALAALIDRAFVAFVKNTIDRYAKTTGNDPTTRLKLRMIDRRMDTLIERMAVRQPAPELRDAAALEQHLIAALWALRQPVTAQPTAAATDAPALAPQSALQQALEAELDKAIVANLDNIASLGSIEQSLRSVPTGTLEDWRDILRDAAREAIDRYRALGENLQQARTCAKEMNRPIAPLPTASIDDGFLLQRLQAETRRAERYRQPLSLALLGPDHVEDIQHLVGTEAVREMLRHYRDNVASCARAYDTVVGCKPHGLLWMLPGASKDQGVLALRKVQQRMVTAHYHYGGRLRPLPTFSAGLVGYTPGDDPADLLVRAEAVAALARRSGPNRIELERSGTVS